MAATVSEGSSHLTERSCPYYRKTKKKIRRVVPKRGREREGGEGIEKKKVWERNASPSRH